MIKIIIKELETLIQKIRLCSQDIGIVFADKNRKNETNNWKKRQNIWRERKLQILENIGNGHHQTSRDERKMKKKSTSNERKLLENKVCNRNLFKGINTKAIHRVRFSRSFLKLTRMEFRQIDQRTRKLNTTSERWHWQIMCREKKYEEDFSSLTIV